MDPTQSYEKQILELIEQSGGISAKKIRTELSISEPTVFKHLKRLVESGQVMKLGKPPRVFYQKSQTQTPIRFVFPTKEEFQEVSRNIHESSIKSLSQPIIEENFLHISPEGKILDGWSGFVYWCDRQKLDTLKTALEYVETLQKYDQYKQNGIIDASFKLQESFDEIYLDKLFYLDFYAIERFGKTKLAQLSFQAKQSQDGRLMREVVELVKDQIVQVVQSLDVQAVGFIPPTVDRKVQFQTALKEGLALPLPHLNLIKLVIDTPIQQKTLKSKDDRVINASTTIFVDDERRFENILLIDDFVGSGSTLNETAKKIRQKSLVTGKLFGLALTGSFKGFEVVSQM
jgi:predicted amidophosphoribosyltransferase/predicted DNA-binding transcriptional regulator